MDLLSGWEALLSLLWAGLGAGDPESLAAFTFGLVRLSGVFSSEDELDGGVEVRLADNW